MAEGTYQHVRCAQQGDILVAEIITRVLHGDLVEQELRDELLTAWQRSNAKHLVLDFAHVHYLTSAVLRVLITLKRHVNISGGQALICNIRDDNALRILTTTRIITTGGSLPAVFEFAPDRLLRQHSSGHPVARVRLSATSTLFGAQLSLQCF